MKMGAKNFDVVDSDQCGAQTNAGTPCQRRTGGPLCWQHNGEPLDAPDELQPPEHLGEAGRKCWWYHIGRLEDHGRMDRADLTVVEGAAELYQMKLNMLKTVEEEGTSIAGRNDTKKKHPALGKYDKFTTEYRKYAKVIEGWLKGASVKDEGSGDPFDF